MVKLKIRFVKFEKALAMQVLEQDESLRGNNITLGYTCTETGLDILSYMNPHLDNDTLFIRGEEPLNDHEVTTIHFSSNKERDEYFNKCTTALRNFAKAGYFNGKPEAEEQEELGDDLIIEV